VHLLRIIPRTPRDKGYASFCPRFAEFINQLSPQGIDRSTIRNTGDHIKLPFNDPGLSFYPQERIATSGTINHQLWPQIRPSLSDCIGDAPILGIAQQSSAFTAPSINYHLKRSI
jgi:hypothetical protein